MEVDESAVFGQQPTAGPSGLGVHLPDEVYDDKNSLDIPRTQLCLIFEGADILISLQRPLTRTCCKSLA